MAALLYVHHDMLKIDVGTCAGPLAVNQSSEVVDLETCSGLRFDISSLKMHGKLCF